MMFKNALAKSGRKLLKAIKKISTARLAGKLQQQERELEQQREQQRERLAQQQQWQQEAIWRLQARLCDLEGFSCSLPSLDAKSVDTYVTYVHGENYCAPEDCCYGPDDCCYVPQCCCYCDEHEENQRNENLENEMMH